MPLQRMAGKHKILIGEDLKEKAIFEIVFPKHIKNIGQV